MVKCILSRTCVRNEMLVYLQNNVILLKNNDNVKNMIRYEYIVGHICKQNYYFSKVNKSSLYYIDPN